MLLLLDLLLVLLLLLLLCRNLAQLTLYTRLRIHAHTHSHSTSDSRRHRSQWIVHMWLGLDTANKVVGAGRRLHDVGTKLHCSELRMDWATGGGVSTRVELSRVLALADDHRALL